MCFKFHECFGIGHGDEDFGTPSTPRRPHVATRGGPIYHQPQPARPAANGYNNGGYYGNGNGYKHAAAVDETGRKANNDVRKDHAAAAAARVVDGHHGRVATYTYAAADETTHRLPAAARNNNKVADHRGTAARFHGPAAANHDDAMADHHYPTTNFGRY